VGGGNDEREQTLNQLLVEMDGFGRDEVFIGRTMAQGRSYSEHVAAQIDEEVKAVSAAAYTRCEQLLTENRQALEDVAQYLLANETMDRKEFLAVFGETEETVHGAENAPAAGTEGGTQETEIM